MKSTIKILFAVCFLLQTNSYGQQMVQNLNDLNKLKENKQLFINRPLKNLLREIKPEIKTASVINEAYTFTFCFRFTSIEQQKKNIGTNSDRTSLIVYVSEPIPWFWIVRPKGNEIIWTREDYKMYADLTVINIDVLSTFDS